MKINTVYFRLFSLILLSALFVFSLTKVGTFTYEAAFAEDEEFSKNTYIGPVSVQGLSMDDARIKLQKAINKWQNDSLTSVSYGDQKVSIPAENIQFLIEESITSAENGVQNPLLVDVNTADLNRILTESISETIVNAVNMDELKSEIETKAEMLEEDSPNISLIPFLNDENELEQTVLSEAAVQAGFISELAEPYILNVEPFSASSFLTTFATKYPSWSDEMLTYAASAMYEASLETNMEIVERHISSEKNNNIAIGFEANIKRDGFDLVLKNPNDFSLQYSIQSKQNGELLVKITGFSLNHSYKVYTSKEKSHPYRKIIQYSPELSIGNEVVKQSGANGSSFTVYRDLLTADGQKVKTETISEDLYLPVNEIRIRAIMVDEEESDEEVIDDNTTNGGVDEIEENQQPSDE